MSGPDRTAETGRTAGAVPSKLLSTLGLCARAGGLVIGTPMVCEALRIPAGKAGRVLAVLEAEDTSENTHHKLTSKCAYYGVPLYRLAVGTVELARAIGKSAATAAVGVTHPGLWQALRQHIEATASPSAD